MSTLAYIIYSVLLVALIVQPHIIRGHINGFSSAWIQSFSSVFIVGLAGLVYWFHQRDIERRERARREAEKELEISIEKFNDAIEYIALVNRRLPLLKNLTTDLLAKSENSKQARQEVLEELLQTAVVSIAQAEWGMFRFIDVERRRTVREFFFNGESKRAHGVAMNNHALVQARTSLEGVARVAEHYVVPTAHRDAPIRCYYVFPPGKAEVEKQVSVLQSIVDQAQLFYRYLYQQ